MDPRKWGTPPDVETPYVLIDDETVQSNIARMAETISRNGVKLRPHIKTHKLPQLAHRQIQAGAVGITAAKVSEAEVMAASGIQDIFIAYPLVSESKIRRAMKLVQTGIRLIIGVDSLEGARRISDVARQSHATIEVRLEIETGLQRTGVDVTEAVPLAQQIATLEGLALTGIYTYRGSMLHGSPTTDIRSAGHEEGKLLASAASRLREAGITIQDVSAGSTPTAQYAAEIEGVTEVRPGTYIFNDRMQVALGACSPEDCASAVIATVVSRPSANRIVIDGGSKTFATDVQPGKAPLHLVGFGLVAGDPTAVFERMNEEHGVIMVQPDANYQVGDVIAIIPNHICSTVNLHNFVYVRDASDRLHQLPVTARGMLD